MGVMLAAPALSAALPSVWVPEVKVTVPVRGALPESQCTVAEIVSGDPAMPGLGVARVTVVTVAPASTTWLRGALEAPEL